MTTCLGCKKELSNSRFRYLSREELPPRLRQRCKDCMRDQPYSRALAKRPASKANKRALRRVNKQQAVKRQRTAARRTAELSAMPSWADRRAIARVYHQAIKVSQQTGVLHHVDHIVPLRGKNVCGLHVACNLQVLPARENIIKSNRF